VRQAEHTVGIVLKRTNFGEADRIVTLLTKDLGKIQVMAKGVRRERSKLAGGIEPFSISEIGVVKGRGDIDTLTSARLVKHYGDVIVGSIEKLDFAYACLKTINKITQTVDDTSFYLLTEHLFTGLGNPKVSLPVVQLWWYVQIAEATGHGINTEKLVDSGEFSVDNNYLYDYEKDGFYASKGEGFSADHVKLLRLAKGHTPALLGNVTGGSELASDLLPMLNGFVESRL
jgi:DNA repair protein RecO (recombination protein O)